jgi:hypothetical protein
MANPTRVTYRLPTGYKDSTAPLTPADIASVDLGIRPDTAPAGVYPLTASDVTFTADANGISAEPLSAFGMLSPGRYVAAGRTRTKSGGVSDWSTESDVFTIAPPTPNPPTALSVL